MSNPSKPVGEDVEAPPSNILWVGYMAADFSEAELMEIFADYGVLDIVISPSTKSYAFAFFMCIEDAKAAMDALHGTSYKGISLKIEFAKPARPCKQLWIGGIGRLVTKEKLEVSFLKFGKIDDVHFFRERNTAIIMFSKLEEASLALKTMNGKHLCGDQIRVDYVRSLSTRRFAQSSEGQKGDGQPSKVLWIGYPPSIKIDDQTLHNAMILFGEIESIKSFPDRNYSFVEFRSVDEARRAKDGLQGRLLNDPRITIMFSSSGLAPGKSGPGCHPGSKGLVTDTGYGHNHPSSLLGAGILGRPFGLLSGLESAFTGHEVGDSNPNRWNASPSSLPGARQPIKSRGNFDAKQYEREAKRSRLNILSTDDDHMSSTNSLQNFGMAHPDEGSADIYSSVRRRSPLGSMAPRISIGMLNHDHADDDHIWRGVIAKGGTPVCQARCVPIQKGTDWELPDLVNCYARTGLEMLEKHYAEALGIEIVYFLPDCEEDFDSYTEFLRYLGDKNRAGVAKLHDGTTLFLVPPSDFLTKILNGAGPKRLYGVVLNLPPAPTTASTMMKQQLNQPLPSPHYSDRQYFPSTQLNYGRISREEESPYQVDQGLNEDPRQMTKPNFPPVESFKSQPTVQQDTSNTPVSQPRVTLTPELIATLANIIPATKQSVTVGSQQPSATPRFWPLATSGTGLSSQEWKENQPLGPMNYMPQHLSNQYDPPAQQSQPLQTYSSVSNSYNHGISVGHTSNNVVDPLDPQQSFNFSWPLTSFSIPSQGGQCGASQQVNQPYEPKTVLNTQISYGLSHLESQYDPAYVSGHVFGSNFAQRPTNLLAAVASTNMGHQSSVKQPHSAPSGSGLSSEVEKNLKYQSTLEFAANLLKQIQQRQQQQQQQRFEPGSGNQ